MKFTTSNWRLFNKNPLKKKKCRINIYASLALTTMIFRYHYYYILRKSFYHQCWLILFHLSLTYSKSPQVSRTLLSILAVLNNVVVLMISTCPLISKSSNPFKIPLVAVPKAPIKIGIIVIFMFHSFSLAKFSYLSSFLLSFNFILCSAGTTMFTILQVLFFCWLIWALVFWPRLGDPFLWQSPVGISVYNINCQN